MFESIKKQETHPCSNGACAHYVMVSKIQWKPFWLAAQLYPHIRAGWQFHVKKKKDVFAQALSGWFVAIVYCQVRLKATGGDLSQTGSSLAVHIFFDFFHVSPRSLLIVNILLSPFRKIIWWSSFSIHFCCQRFQQISLQKQRKENAKRKTKENWKQSQYDKNFFSFDTKENNHAELTLSSWRKCVARMKATCS